MKINRFIGGLAGLVLAACGPENNSRNDSGNNGNNDLDGGNVNECTLDSECGNDRYCDKTITPYVCKAKQGNLPPVVTLEIRDYQTKEIKTDYKVGEIALFYITAKDSDCETKQSCGSTKGIASCALVKSNASIDFIPDEQGKAILSSGTLRAIGTFDIYVQCKDSDDNLESKSSSVTLNVQN